MLSSPPSPSARNGVILGEASHLAPVICFSHLRWDFVFQRPQHLMSRLAQSRTVLFFEEPVPADADGVGLETSREGVIVATPQLAPGGEDRDARLARLLDDACAQAGIGPAILWYYTPMMLGFSAGRTNVAIVYDCMDELSAFDFAPPELKAQEAELFARADIVFTGGQSLYEAKRHQHPNVHAFPSSVDVAHFRAARTARTARPAGQGLRLGFYGVIDERLDLDLVAKLAEARPDWSIEMIGPVVKIDPTALPDRPNIAWVGARSYQQLPDHLAGWDIALMPFAINAATRFISPTKTPEYLAGGCPVVSTPIYDVVRDYGPLEAVSIADDAAGFADAAERLAALPPGGEWLEAVDARLADISWDRTLARMTALIDAASARRSAAPAASTARPRRKVDYLIVGAGFAGSVLAERLANDAGATVLLIDKRPHIGGNAYDHHDAAGVLIHRYGPHIFHTNSADVFTYLSRFTAWRDYQHRVLADVRGQLVPIPINRTTLNLLYGAELRNDQETAAFLAGRAEPRSVIATSEDVVVSAVGRELYELFFRGYTRKQWGLDPSELDRAVTARVPTRTNTDDRYFTDQFQAMPRDGYTAMFERMLDAPGIEIQTAVDYADIRDEVDAGHVIFSGPIDEYFGHRFGALPYRSLEFRHETVDRERFQPVAVVNYPDEAVPYTRITEYKQLTGQRHPRTSISYEYPRAEGDPYYPIPRPANQALYKRYEALADATPGVTFVGRLATYRYYNMDQIVGQALATYRRLAQRGTVVERIVPARQGVPG